MKKALIVATVIRFLECFEKSDIKILKDLGYEIHTAANMSEADWLSYNGALDDLGVVYHQIDFGRTPFSKQSVKAYKELKKLLEEMSFDLIHCHTPVASAVLRLAVNRKKMPHVKIIYTAHGFHFHKSSGWKNWLFYYPIERFLARKTDMIITINQEDFAVAQKYGTKYKRYIPGVGVDTEYISGMEADRDLELSEHYHIPKNAYVIMTVGELSDRKNQITVMEALGQLKDREWYYILAGTGDKKEELQNVARRLGLEDRVIFTGFLNHDEVLKLDHVVDLGVIPSVIEGLGIAGIEFLAAGTPIVGSKVHGIKDYLIEGENGILCDPHNVSEFARAIRKMMDDKAFYNACRKNAKKTSESFDIRKVERLMRENYECVQNE